MPRNKIESIYLQQRGRRVRLNTIILLILRSRKLTIERIAAKNTCKKNRCSYLTELNYSLRKLIILQINRLKRTKFFQTKFTLRHTDYMQCMLPRYKVTKYAFGVKQCTKRGLLIKRNDKKELFCDFINT